MEALAPNTGPMSQQTDYQTASALMQRFWFACQNGHQDYVFRNRRNYRYYQGDGGQWSEGDREYMESVQGRKCFEINLLKQAVLTAEGEQIATRADIVYKPKKGDASAETATVLSKLVKHFLEQNNYHALESEVWKSGLVAERGYFDIRMQYDGNLDGEIVITTPDPVTVIPNIFSTEYDPKHWTDVTRFMWLTLDEIEGMYGVPARKKAESDWTNYKDRPFTDDFPVDNPSDSNYGMATTASGYYQWWDNKTTELRLRVIERQYNKREMAYHYINPQTKDTRIVPASLSLAEARQYAMDNGLILQKMNGNRVMWTVSTATTMLHDSASPYETFTIVPFFYLFDKGHTGCMVSDGISAQDLLNKSISAEVHYLTSVANSGWIVRRGALTNMTTADIADVGMKTGIVIEVSEERSLSESIQKIQPNQFPSGMDKMSGKAQGWIMATTGMSDTEQDMRSPEESGVAVAMKQFQSKMQLAKPLSNLQLTRTLVGRKLMELIQQFITNERIYIITGPSDYGQPTQEQLAINQIDPSGAILNDITVGEYEVEVSTQPMASTYEESQFRQLVTMREQMQVAIPDDEIVLRSNLANKKDLAEKMNSSKSDPAQELQMEMMKKQIAEKDAQIQLLIAKADSEIAKTTNTNIQAMFGATNAGMQIAATPGVAAVADSMMLSAGFKDHDAARAIPQGASTPTLGAPVQPVVPANTSPNFPPQADSGYGQGLEGGE